MLMNGLYLSNTHRVNCGTETHFSHSALAASG